MLCQGHQLRKLIADYLPYIIHRLVITWSLSRTYTWVYTYPRKRKKKKKKIRGRTHTILPFQKGGNEFFVLVFRYVLHHRLQGRKEEWEKTISVKNVFPRWQQIWRPKINNKPFEKRNRIWHFIASRTYLECLRLVLLQEFPKWDSLVFLGERRGVPRRANC